MEVMNESCKRIEWKGEYGHLAEHYFTFSVNVERLIANLRGVTLSHDFFCKVISFDGVDYIDFEQAYDAIRKWVGGQHENKI